MTKKGVRIMLNVVAIMGRLVADPELRTTQSGTNVCSFRIACDRNFARQGEQRQADFIDIRRMAPAGRVCLQVFPEGQSDRHRRQSPDPPVSGQERKQPHRCGGRGKQRQLCWLQIEWQQSGRRQLSECCSVLPERSSCPVRLLWRQLPATLPAMQTTSPSSTTATTCRSDSRTGVLTVKIQ